MTRVVVVGERGEVTQTIKVGPAVLLRPRVWDDLPRLTEIVASAGLEAEALDPCAATEGIPEPDAWILSDLPYAAAVSSGLYARLADPAGTAGMLMLGGALSFAGQLGAGGWQGTEPDRLWPVEVGKDEDAVETPAGCRVRRTNDCPADLAELIGHMPPVFGYNAVEARLEATILARFEDGRPAIVTMEREGRSRAVFTSDLMPHWGTAIASWPQLPELVGALIGLVLRHDRAAETQVERTTR